MSRGTKQVTIGTRLRLAREMRDASQADVGKAIGITRAGMSHYEKDQRTLPFSTGLALCRFLDIHPVWLASGSGEETPFIDPTHEAVDAKVFQEVTQNRVEFAEGVRRLRLEPLTSASRAVLSQIRQGPEEVARRASMKELESTLHEWAGNLRNEADESQKFGTLVVIETYAAEIRRRLELRLPHMRGFGRKIQG